MRTLALTAALATALTGTGCFVSASDPGPTGSVDLFWEFVRTDWSGNTFTYDPEASAPAGTTGACATSGVDRIAVSWPGGAINDLACRRAGTQGVSLDGVPSGPTRFTVTGYAGNRARYSTSVTVDVPVGSASVPQRVVRVFGIPDNLDVFFDFAEANGVVVANNSCAGQTIDFFTFNIFDGTGRTIVSTEMFPGLKQPCTDLSPGPGVALDAIDRDDYTIRARAYRNGTVAPIFDSCDTVVNTSAHFTHDGPDTGANGWPVLVLYKSCP